MSAVDNLRHDEYAQVKLFGAWLVRQKSCVIKPCVGEWEVLRWVPPEGNETSILYANAWGISRGGSVQANKLWQEYLRATS